MALDPLARAFLEIRMERGWRPIETLSVAQARQQTLAMLDRSSSRETLAHIHDELVDGIVPVRVYTPHGQGPFPILVYLHGGGWVTGSLETADPACRHFANAIGCIVCAVDYRLSPEHKFPTPVYDAYAATRWASAHANEWNGEPTRLAIGGTSAGANLAAAVTLLVRERQEFALTFQLLIVPPTKYEFDTVSSRENADGYDLTRGAVKWSWHHYLTSSSDGTNPLASPLRATTLKGLPPALIQTAEFDPLRDEGEAYAARLQAESVPATLHRFAGMLHGFLGPAAMPEAVSALRRAFQLPNIS
jgi:acetyl esterase